LLNAAKKGEGAWPSGTTHELRAREYSGQDPPPVNGEFELLGELGGSFVAGVNGQRDINSSGNRGFSRNMGFINNRGFNSNRDFSNNVEYNILTNFGSSI
jgi:hypothetical protein